MDSMRAAARSDWGGGIGICIDNVFDLVERVRVRRLTAREDSLRAAILVELHS